MRAVGIRVVLAEDNVLLREGVVRLLGSVADVEVVGSCGSFADLVSLVAETVPDVVVTDIRMPPTGTDEGIRAANLFRETHPGVGVVVLSQYADPAYALALLEHGSEQRAYLLKDRVSDIDQLVDAIRVVSDGGSVIDPKVVEELVAARARKPPSRLEHLTGRERDILHEMAQGRSNAAIADSLVLTKRAVEKHIHSIFMKLGLAFEQDVSKRVKAALLFLAERDGR